MAIVDHYEFEVRDYRMIGVVSDASDNFQAIEEIEAWANENDAVRVKEYWLKRRRTQKGDVFEGTCLPK
ncbi:MAG: hypothetical protein BIFFINMI_04278 [Phycisphaerae bacterium]|nr:hypothetical protein [Phycisphaerae bacterium]